MAIGQITVRGQSFWTLRELLRPGLKAVFVGLNPSPRSVELGHYYQGRHGKRFWNRLRKHHIIQDLPSTAEDDVAFERHYGFADLVRRPTISSKELDRVELLEAVHDLAFRLKQTNDYPSIIFTYKDPWTLAGPHLAEVGYQILRFPGPYMKKNLADAMMVELQIKLGIAN